MHKPVRLLGAGLIRWTGGWSPAAANTGVGALIFRTRPCSPNQSSWPVEL